MLKNIASADVKEASTCDKSTTQTKREGFIMKISDSFNIFAIRNEDTSKLLYTVHTVPYMELPNLDLLFWGRGRGGGGKSV